MTGNPHLVGLKTICKQSVFQHSVLFPTSLSAAPTNRTVTYASTSVTVKSEAQNQKSVPQKHGSCSWCTNGLTWQLFMAVVPASKSSWQLKNSAVQYSLARKTTGGK